MKPEERAPTLADIAKRLKKVYAPLGDSAGAVVGKKFALQIVAAIDAEAAQRKECAKQHFKDMDETRTYLRCLRDEIAMGKVHVRFDESKETLSPAINAQSKTIELIVKGLGNVCKAIDDQLRLKGFEPTNTIKSPERTQGRRR